MEKHILPIAKQGPGFDWQHPGLIRVNAAMDRIYALVEDSFGRARPRPTKLEPEARFVAMPVEQQKTIIDGMESLLRFFECALEENVPLTDDLKLLEFASKQLRLSINKNILDQLSNEDLMEIFSPDALQVYRSFSFFKYCNYSLLELSTYPWFELYKRSSSVESDLLRLSGSIFDGSQEYIPLKTFMAPYTLKELWTERPESFMMTESLLSRMRHWPSGNIYMLSTKRVTPIAVEAQPEKIYYI